GFGTQCGDDFGVGGELFSVVVSDRFDASGERQKDASARPHDGVCALVRELGELGVFGLAVDVRHDDAFVTRADNRVGFPVADAAFLGDNRGALVDVHAVRNQATTRGFALTLVVLFTAVTQLEIKGSAVLLVFPDMLVDALVADRAGAVFHQPAADLIGAPLLLRQFFLDQFYEIWLHLAWCTRGCLSSLRRLLLRLFEAIAPRAGVAIQLALDRRAMNAKLAPYGGLREAALHEGVNLTTFFVGQMVIAFGHMSSVRCGVPREGSLHLAVRDPACTTWKSVAGEKDGLKGARYSRIAAGDLRPCPRPFPLPLCSTMSSMHRCCTSELNRRRLSARQRASSHSVHCLDLHDPQESRQLPSAPVLDSATGAAMRTFPPIIT